jgi:hypothetical protein
VVVLDSGERVGHGDAIEVIGARATIAELPQGSSPDSYFGSFGGFCSADESGVMVLKDVTPG